MRPFGSDVFGVTDGAADMNRRLSRSATLALILSPVGLLIISAARLLIVANYSPATAATVASSGGYVDVLLGTIIPLVPIFAPYLALGLLFANRVIPSILTFLVTALVSPTAVTQAGALTLVTTDWDLIARWVSSHPYILILAIPAGLLLAAALLTFRFSVFLRTAAAPVASILLFPYVFQIYPVPFNGGFYAELLRQPWLPAERITLTTHQNLIGYVLSSGSDWFIVLSDNSRTISYYHAKEVATQQVCRIGRARRTRPLIALVPAAAQIPPCVLPSSPVSGAAPTKGAPSSRAPGGNTPGGIAHPAHRAVLLTKAGRAR
jgi:hypothetical protein